MKIGDIVRIEFNDGQQMIGLYNGEDEKYYYITHYFTNLFKRNGNLISGQAYRKNKVKIRVEYMI
jgi:hypothetical protein